MKDLSSGFERTDVSEPCQSLAKWNCKLLAKYMSVRVGGRLLTLLYKVNSLSNFNHRNAGRDNSAGGSTCRKCGRNYAVAWRYEYTMWLFNMRQLHQTMK